MIINTALGKIQIVTVEKLAKSIKWWILQPKIKYANFTLPRNGSYSVTQVSLDKTTKATAINFIVNELLEFFHKQDVYLKTDNFEEAVEASTLKLAHDFRSPDYAVTYGNNFIVLDSDCFRFAFSEQEKNISGAVVIMQENSFVKIEYDPELKSRMA